MRISKTGICSKGFTLIELLIGLFIVTLVLTLAIPSFSVVAEGRIKSDAKRVSSALRYLNDTARSAKETLALKVDMKERLVTYDSPGGRAETIKLKDLSWVEAQSRGMVKEGELVIFFNPTGATEALTFHLDDGREALSVVFNPLSGRVKIIEWVH